MFRIFMECHHEPHHLKRAFLLSVCYVVVTILTGGLVGPVNSWAQSESHPEVLSHHWSHWMHGEQADLQLALETFDEQSTHFTAQRSCGAKPFQRWAWWMQTRGASRTDPESWWIASKLWRDQLSSSNSTSNSSVDSWTYVGKRHPCTWWGWTDQQNQVGPKQFQSLVRVRSLWRALALHGCREFLGGVGSRCPCTTRRY